MATNDMTQDIIYTITNPKVTFNQRLKDMAKIAENSVELVNYTEKSKEYFANGAMMDMFEGKSPYRTRYCLPDYELFLKQGSEFLMLEPPKDIWDAVGNLLCLYHNIPDDGGLPVYIGCLDKLLEPFVKDEAEAEKAIRFLLVHVDRTISNAFCHADLSGEDTKAGRIILKLTKEMGRPCPNMTLMWREDTPDDYMMAALDTAMAAAKPSFANDKLYRRDMGDYAVVSCYNTLPIGGCGLTLVRLNMNRLPELAESPEDLLNRVIPDAVTAVCDAIDSRCEFIIDFCHFYENTFLYREGLIKKDRDHMIGMFGFVWPGGVRQPDAEPDGRGGAVRPRRAGGRLRRGDHEPPERRAGQAPGKIRKIRPSRPGGSDGGHGFHTRRPDSHRRRAGSALSDHELHPDAPPLRRRLRRTVPLRRHGKEKPQISAGHFKGSFRLRSQIPLLLFRQFRSGAGDGIPGEEIRSGEI